MPQATLEELPFTNSNLFSTHYLDERLRDREEWKCDEEAREVFDELQELWRKEGSVVSGQSEDDLVGNWIAEVLSRVGFGVQKEASLPEKHGFVDGLLFESEGERRSAAEDAIRSDDNTEVFRRAVAVMEAKQWDAEFDARYNEDRAYWNASQQVKHYLGNTPDNIRWGVLTNGRKWRLYGTHDYQTETYYEVDLPELLESGELQKFKYFYLFYRPEAFRRVDDSCFLDSVWSESETAAQELGEDLQDNVFTALRVLGRGFMESNDLDIEPEDEESLDELKNQSLVLLYRLMFVLYAESRGLIHPEGNQAVKEYEENFSLDRLRLEIHEEIGEHDTGFDEEYSRHSTRMWSRLENLFRLIDEGEESLGIPPYNGGLFDREGHGFLAENEVSDRCLAEVVYRLSTTESEDGRFVLADYGDLDTRHLGSVYEGLLEHQFRVADGEVAAVAEDGGEVWRSAEEVSVADAVEVVESGGLYVVNDEGERKATGAYYTPDYVVSYIVEETLGPLVEEIRDDLVSQGFERGSQEYVGPFIKRVTDLDVLDPAMGSAHFLTNATGYLTEEVMKEIRDVEEEMDIAWDEGHLRREIAKDCIYGVDVNPMAVELAKLSMWLETLAADRPLAFLDHHLKHGNSLVGSDVTEILSNGDDDGGEDGQMTIQESIGRVREETLDHVMDLMQELLEVDNESLDDIKSMEDLYREIQDDVLYQRLKELANVDTAEEFGVDVPEDAYRRMADAIEDTEKWNEVAEETWFQEAQELAREQSFFHWELEFPAVFFDENGLQREDSGFDGVIGNPPYVRQEQLQSIKPYFESEYDVYHGVADLYAYFFERGTRLMNEGGSFGYIVSNKFMQTNYGEPLRDYLSSQNQIREIIDFGELPVFPEASTYPSIFILDGKTPDEDGSVTVAKLDDLEFSDLTKRVNEVSYEVQHGTFDEGVWSLADKSLRNILSKIDTVGESLEKVIGDQLYRGLVTGLNEAFVIGEQEKQRMESELISPFSKGDDIHRYLVEDEGRSIIIVPSGWTREASGYSEKEAAWNWFSDKYPAIADHLSQYEVDARERYDRGEFWWELRPCDYYDKFEEPKIVYPDISKGSNFALDTEGRYLANTCYFLPTDSGYVLGVLNSSLIDWYYRYITSEYRGGYQRSFTQAIKDVPIPSISFDTPDSERASRVSSLLDSYEDYLADDTGKPLPEADDVAHDFLAELAEEMTDLKSTRHSLNLSLFDHLGISTDDELEGPKVTEVGLTQPPDGVADTPLSKTKDDLDSLRVGRAEVHREDPSSVEVRLTARYKPEDLDSDDSETDQWGYIETEPLPALRVTDLSEVEADLVEAFVPRAVDEAGGFADFRETATKTNSLINRLKKTRLPDPSNVESGLQSYQKTKKRADELDEKIEKTDELIDEIVYELYGLTKEEIEVVEEAVE